MAYPVQRCAHSACGDRKGHLEADILDASQERGEFIRYMSSIPIFLGSQDTELCANSIVKNYKWRHPKKARELINAASFQTSLSQMQLKAQIWPIKCDLVAAML